MSWAFNLAALVSAVLFVGVCVLWVRSDSHGDYVYYTVSRGARFESYGLLARKGILQFDDFKDGGPHQWSFSGTRFWRSGRSGPWDWGSLWLRDRDFLIAFAMIDEDASRGALGFHEPATTWAGFGAGSKRYPRQGLRGRDPQPPDGFCRFVTAPAWSLALLTGVLPLITARRLIRRVRRARAGLCRICGYDLRATPSRCPECGGLSGIGRKSVSPRLPALL